MIDLNKPHVPFNIMFVGDPAVGKTTLISTFKNTFYDRSYYIETIGLMLIHDTVEYKNYIADVTFWDTAGQKRYRKPTARYLKMRKIDAVGLIYDLTRPKTLDSAIRWVNKIQKSGKDIFIAIIGNKMDLPHDDKLIKDTMEQFNDFGNIYHYCISALTYNGIKQAFFDIIYQGLYYKLTKDIRITNEVLPQ